MKKKPLKPPLENPSKKRKLLAAAKKSETKKTKKKKQQRPAKSTDDRPVQERDGNGEIYDQANNSDALPKSASEQLQFFLAQYQSANGVQLSSLELESLSDARILELSQCTDQVTETFGEDMKVAFGPSWKEVLCEKELSRGKIDPGNPAILVVSASALRSIEFLRGLRLFTKECHAVKLFSKHMKVEDQVSLLKNRVNIASGTPSRIKKLIDIEALGLSRLAVVVLDVRPDVKGYSLFTLPQVRDEFWDLYKNYFHQRLLEGALSLTLYGPLPNGTELKGKKKNHDN